MAEYSHEIITSGNILSVCRYIEDTRHDETAARVKTVIGQIFRFAIAADYTQTDPTAALLGVLRPRNNKHYATITNSDDIAILMSAIKAYPYTVCGAQCYFRCIRSHAPVKFVLLNGQKLRVMCGIFRQAIRAMFSTIANEHGINRDVIERQLAHVEENSVRGAYNHAEYMPERIKLMQWWADYLDSLINLSR